MSNFKWSQEALDVAESATLECMDEAANSGWWKGKPIGGQAHAQRILDAATKIQPAVALPGVNTSVNLKPPQKIVPSARDWATNG